MSNILEVLHTLNLSFCLSQECDSNSLLKLSPIEHNLLKTCQCIISRKTNEVIHS